MSQADANAVSNFTARALVQAVRDFLMFVGRAVLGSLLGISTASIFAVFTLVAFAELNVGVAITAVALGMNAMLLSLVTLGNLGSADTFETDNSQ